MIKLYYLLSEAVKLLSSLVGVALSLSVGIENSQKLSKVQKTKTMRQKGPAQQERIQKKITEVRHHVSWHLSV